jgi:hypothetical protein
MIVHGVDMNGIVLTPCAGKDGNVTQIDNSHA